MLIFKFFCFISLYFCCLVKFMLSSNKNGLLQSPCCLLKVTSFLSRLLEEVLHYINTVASSVEGNMDKPTAKFWRVLLSKCYDMLDKVCLTSPHVSTGTWLLLLVNRIINFVGFLVALVLYFIGWPAAWCINV